MKAKSGHPWLAERRKGDLVVKCDLKAKSSNPPLAERLKDDLLGLDTVRSYRNGSNITLWTTYGTKPSSTVTTSYNGLPTFLD